MEKSFKTASWKAINLRRSNSRGAEPHRQPCLSCPTNAQRDSLSFRWYGGGHQRKQCIYCRISACYQRAVSRCRTPFSESDKEKVESAALRVYDKWEEWMRAQALDIRETREDVLSEMQNRHAALVPSHATPSPSTLSQSRRIDQIVPRLATSRTTCRTCKTTWNTSYFAPLTKGKDADLTTTCIRCRIKHSVKKKKASLAIKRFECKQDHEEAWQRFGQTPSEILQQWEEEVGIPRPEVPNELVVLLSGFVTNLEGSLLRQLPAWYPENTPLPEDNSPPSPPDSASMSISDEDSSADYSGVEEVASNERAKRMASEPPPTQRPSKKKKKNKKNKRNSEIILLSPPSSSGSRQRDINIPRINPNAVRIVLPEVVRPPEIRQSTVQAGDREIGGVRSSKTILEGLFKDNKECLNIMLASLSKLTELDHDFSEKILRHSLATWKVHASKFKKAVLVATRQQEIENERRKLATWFSDKRKLTPEAEEDHS